MRTPYFGVFTVKIFWVFRLDQAPKNRSSSIPVSGRGPRAYPLGSPPPGRAAQCCEAFKAEVSFCRCLFWLFSFQGAPGISKAGCRDRRVFSDLLDTVLLDGCPGSLRASTAVCIRLWIVGIALRFPTSCPGLSIQYRFIAPRTFEILRLIMRMQ